MLYIAIPITWWTWFPNSLESRFMSEPTGSGMAAKLLNTVWLKKPDACSCYFKSGYPRQITCMGSPISPLNFSTGSQMFGQRSARHQDEWKKHGWSILWYTTIAPAIGSLLKTWGFCSSLRGMRDLKAVSTGGCNKRETTTLEAIWGRRMFTFMKVACPGKYGR